MGRRKLSELSAARLWSAAKRRIHNLPANMSWKYSALSRKNQGQLARFKDLYAGQRCFVIGNGPSLNETDLDKLAGEITFGANRLYLLEKDRGFRPTFLTAMDEKIIEQFAEELAAWDGEKFLRWRYRGLFKGVKNVSYLHTFFKAVFTSDLSKPIWGGYTVTFANLQLAYYMGFKDVVLIGCDHSYAESGTPNVDIRVEDLDQNHFSPDYYTKEHTFRIPDYVSQEYAYLLARKAFEADGRRVVDATVGGKLKIFEKVEYDSLFKEEER